MDDEKIIKLQHFFEVDALIKKEMSRNAPNLIQYFDDSTLLEYSFELYDMLKYIIAELKCVVIDIFGKQSTVLSRINYLEKLIWSGYYYSKDDLSRIKVFYNNYVSVISKDFLKSVSEECVGYTFGRTGSIEKASSLDEVLHFIHSYVVNNENILQAIPLLKEKKNDFNYNISLRGINAPVFSQLFDDFPINMDVGYTDMVIINEKKLIMMVRDRGHALTIEISLNRDIARMEYFIPKLCNIEMINRLPGVEKVNENSTTTTGIIEVPITDLSNTLFDLISKVPMDSDMVSIAGRKNY